MFDRVVEIINKMVAGMKLFLVVVVTVVSYSSASPARLRRGIYIYLVYIGQIYISSILAPQETSNRFFTGNSAIDAGAAGAALGAAAQFFGNQILNPCRGGNRNRNKDTNNRFLNGQTVQNGALGFLAGFAGSSLINTDLGNPCGK